LIRTLEELSFENVGTDAETLKMIRDLIIWKQDSLKTLNFINMGFSAIDLEYLFDEKL
jgi:hypothetical protein